MLCLNFKYYEFEIYIKNKLRFRIGTLNLNMSFLLYASVQKWTEVDQNESKWSKWTEVNTNGPNGIKWTEQTKQDQMGTRRTEQDQSELNRIQWWTNMDRVGTIGLNRTKWTNWTEQE